ncbi:MAG: amino acid ABC transporter ATP-binding protein [Chlorobium sp.]|nr:MAG: amino acid ABC transporter ATP-binding protein [Chlorobium sp.]
MIKIEHLSKNFGSLSVLRDISVEIKEGEVISIIGPSGAGKSTFLRCINLLDRPSSGSILIKGINILDPKIDVAKVRQKMNMVFQAFNLFAHISVLENLTIAPMKLLGKSRESAEKKAHELLNLVGLSDKAGSYPDELSGGQKQRVAIARCLAMEPEVILFDEPTSALDPTMINEVLSVIRRLARQGLTMLIVTHELDFAKDVSSRVFYLDEGGIYEDGTPRQIFENPQKEKTKAFIKKQESFYQHIVSSNYDLYALIAEVDCFCSRLMVNVQSRKNLMVLIEEVLQLFRKSTLSFPLDMTVNYEEKTEMLELLFEAPPGSVNPMLTESGDNGSALPAIESRLQSQEYRQLGGRNRLSLYLKKP